MKISKYGNSEYGNIFENDYHILTFKYGKKKTYAAPCSACSFDSRDTPRYLKVLPKPNLKIGIHYRLSHL